MNQNKIKKSTYYLSNANIQVENIEKVHDNFSQGDFKNMPIKQKQKYHEKVSRKFLKKTLPQLLCIWAANTEKLVRDGI